MIRILLFFTLSIHLFADCLDVLENHTGWTILQVKTIEGYKDKEKKPENSFEGCEYDRKIFFTDNTYVECRSYSYHYAYRPKAVILGKSIEYNGKHFNTYKMIVNGDDYDINIGR